MCHVRLSIWVHVGSHFREEDPTHVPVFRHHYTWCGLCMPHGEKTEHFRDVQSVSWGNRSCTVVTALTAWGWELKFSLGFRPSALIDCSGRSSSRPICPVLSPLSLNLNKFRGSYPQVVLALQSSYMSSQTNSYLQWDEILTPLKILFLNPTKFLISTVLIFPDSHHWYKSPNLSSTHPWIIYYSWFYYFKKAPIKMIPADSFFWHNIIYRQ